MAVTVPVDPSSPEEMTPQAWLLEKRWAQRVIGVGCGDETFVIRYNGRGWGTEYVFVDDIFIVRRSRQSMSMSHGFRFGLGDRHVAALSIAIPWWCDVLPFRDLSFVKLEIDGLVVYEEGEPPKRELKWTSSVTGFPVICPPTPAATRRTSEAHCLLEVVPPLVDVVARDGL